MENYWTCTDDFAEEINKALEGGWVGPFDNIDDFIASLDGGGDEG